MARVQTIDQAPHHPALRLEIVDVGELEVEDSEADVHAMRVRSSNPATTPKASRGAGAERDAELFTSMDIESAVRVQMQLPRDLLGELRFEALGDVHVRELPLLGVRVRA